MEFKDVITIAAIILGPIFAVQAEKWLQRNREAKNRKEDIFKTLMATRGSVLSVAHVEALNRIDLEFSNDKRFTKVIESWKEYFDNLCRQVNTDDEVRSWTVRNEELLANLLYEMGQSLGYKFDKVLIKRNIYSPLGHGRTQQEIDFIRNGILKVLKGEVAIPMTLEHISVSEEEKENQIKLQKLMIEYYEKQNIGQSTIPAKAEKKEKI